MLRTGHTPLLTLSPPGRKKRYALTDEGLEHFRKAYPGIEMSKEDIFYYVYGLLHAPWYRDQYADKSGQGTATDSLCAGS